jgi:hypothetical protein
MKIRSDDLVPRYLEKLMRLPAERGQAYIAEVRHDDFCDHWYAGMCNCDPEVSLVPVPAQYGE